MPKVGGVDFITVSVQEGADPLKDALGDKMMINAAYEAELGNLTIPFKATDAPSNVPSTSPSNHRQSQRAQLTQLKLEIDKLRGPLRSSRLPTRSIKRAAIARHPSFNRHHGSIDQAKPARSQRSKSSGPTP